MRAIDELDEFEFLDDLCALFVRFRAFEMGSYVEGFLRTVVERADIDRVNLDDDITQMDF